MEFQECVHRRHSYRRRFLPEKPSRELLRHLLELAFRAPSGCNLQTVRFIAVDDERSLAELAELYGHAWAKTAPAAVLLLADPNCKRGDGPSRVPEDFAAAAENLLLAVTDAGLSSVWIQGQIEGEIAEKMADVLAVPAPYRILGYFPIGKAAEEVCAPPKLPFEERCFLNRFGASF